MKKEFFQELMNTMMFKKLTTVFPFLRKEKLEHEDVKENIRRLQKEGLIDAIKNSCQDPKEMVDMAIIAFDKGVAKMRERFVMSVTLMLAEIKNKTENK